MSHITIVNGPNLNLLGRRQPEIYGGQTFEQVLRGLRLEFAETQIDYHQSNHEGELLDILQREGFQSDGIVLNAGAYTHTSVALADAVAAIPAPVVEVHISNVFAREPFRHHSYLSPYCAGVIAGLGMRGYGLAIRYLLEETSGSNQKC